MKHRLWGMRCYLMGAMDRAKDGGVEWRKRLTPFLQRLGVVVLDPCNKPIEIGHETNEDRKRRHALKSIGNYDAVAKEIKLLRVIDLRMVDMSDFSILNVDTDIHMCGSYEEASWANRLKNPILIHCEQGKSGIPDWLLGELPHQHIFDKWVDLYYYLWRVHTCPTEVKHYKRWIFFDYSVMVPRVTQEESSLMDFNILGTEMELDGYVSADWEKPAGEIDDIL